MEYPKKTRSLNKRKILQFSTPMYKSIYEDRHVPHIINQRFEIESLLSKGGQGFIFCARDLLLQNRLCLIKMPILRV